MSSGTKLYGNDLEQVDNSGTSTDYELTKRFLLESGNYVIIPSLAHESKNENFLLRIFTEKESKTR